MKNNSLLLTFLISLLFFGSCSVIQNHENKALYTVKVGESFNYYVSSNSCCPYCWLNKNTTTSIQYMGSQTIEVAPDDCDGCTSWHAYVFKAIKPGQDTIKHFYIAPHNKCSDSLLNSFKTKPQFSIVKVIE